MIEAFLEGEEISVLAITDGRDVELLPVVAGPQAPARGGRAAPTPAAWGRTVPVAVATPALLARARAEVLLPTLEEMRRRETPYTGVLYAGLMVDRAGTPMGGGVQLPPRRSRDAGGAAAGGRRA